MTIRRPVAILTATSLAFCSSSTQQATAVASLPRAASPSVILIVADNLAYGELSA